MYYPYNLKINIYCNRNFNRIIPPQLVLLHPPHKCSMITLQPRNSNLYSFIITHIIFCMIQIYNTTIIHRPFIVHESFFWNKDFSPEHINFFVQNL